MSPRAEDVSSPAATESRLSAAHGRGELTFATKTDDDTERQLVRTRCIDLLSLDRGGVFFLLDSEPAPAQQTTTDIINNQQT